jgi:hypothetical protein
MPGKIGKPMNSMDLLLRLNPIDFLNTVFIAFCLKAAYRCRYCACKGHRESWPDAVDLNDPLIDPLYQRLQLSLGPDIRRLRLFQLMFQELVHV